MFHIIKMSNMEDNFQKYRLSKKMKNEGKITKIPEIFLNIRKTQIFNLKCFINGFFYSLDLSIEITYKNSLLSLYVCSNMISMTLQVLV